MPVAKIEGDTEQSGQLPSIRISSKPVAESKLTISRVQCSILSIGCTSTSTVEMLASIDACDRPDLRLNPLMH